MEKIKTILVEDEEASLYLLKEELYSKQNIEIIGEFRNGRDGLEGINRLNPDLVFVDIEMPAMNGFQMLQRLTCNPAIIFCTGHKHYALQAWDYDASDFVIKPIDPKRIAKALEKALDDIRNKNQEARLTRQKSSAGFIEINWIDPKGKKSRYFAPDEITYIQGDRDYLKIFVQPELAKELGLYQNLLTVKKTIKVAAEELEKHGFIQIHKSYLINQTKVLEWNRTKKEIRLDNIDQPLPIGRAFLKTFQKRWEQES